MNQVCYGLVAREVERIELGLPLNVVVQSSLVMHPIESFGSEAQAKISAQAGDWRMDRLFGLTEADAGSDPDSMRTIARKTDTGYVMNGAKMWISNAPIADVFIIWQNQKPMMAKSGFVLEKGIKGLSADPIKGKLSLRASIAALSA